MLIISNWHEWYDTASIYGIDKTCVYQRKEEILSGNFDFSDNLGGRWPYVEEFVKVKSGIRTTYQVNKRIVGFCGKLYPVVTVRRFNGTKTEYFAFYSADKIYDFFIKEKVKLESGNGYWSMRDFSIKTESGLKNFLDVSQFKKMEEYFHKYKCPVFIYGRFQSEEQTKVCLILNPKLKNYRFAQVKDSQTAFQDIFMYLSGVIGMPEVPMVKISDKEMAKKKGHDGKYSFRKPKGKRGKVKWR